MEKDNYPKLQEFRNLIKSKMTKFWEDEKDIQLAIHQTLPEFSRDESLIGWIKSDESINVSDMSNELARLSKENAELREKLNSKELDKFAGVSFKQMVEILKKTKVINEDKVKVVSLLVYFWEIRKSLARGKSSFDNEASQELAVKGLITTVIPQNRSFYTLTDTGYAFLNRLESELNENESKTIYDL